MACMQGNQTSQAQSTQALLDMVPNVDGQLSPDTKICKHPDTAVACKLRPLCICICSAFRCSGDCGQSISITTLTNSKCRHIWLLCCTGQWLKACDGRCTSTTGLQPSVRLIVVPLHHRLTSSECLHGREPLMTPFHKAPLGAGSVVPHLE